MLTLHRWIKTWNQEINVYLVATDFYRNKFIEGGLPESKIVKKPHFVLNNPNNGEQYSSGNYALFIARLDPEKGVRTMLQAWKELKDIPLKIRGSGQLLGEMQGFITVHDMKHIEILEHLDNQGMDRLRKNARFLVWPSDGFYETFGLVAIECFACGIPVIASRTGVMNEIVTEGLTGLHFTPGDSTDLAGKVRWAWDHPQEMAKMGRNARREYEEKYTAEKNYNMLMDIYRDAIEANRKKVV